MKKGVFLFLLLYLASAAYANPVIVPDPLSIFSYTVVLFSAFIVEVSIVTILLLFFDLSAKPVWIVLFMGNLVVYFTIFLPLLHAVPSLLVVEGLIVMIDGILIKAISLYDTFQEETFKELKWKYALVIAVLGNISSYYVGAVMGH